MRHLSYIGSILNNTNQLISESDADWSAIREGTLIKFKHETAIYNAVKLISCFYIRDFNAISQRSLVIKDNCSLYLSPGDVLSLSFKEYELDKFGLLSSGRDYKEGDFLFLSEGNAVVNVEDGSKHQCIFRVAEVLPEGAIVKLSLENRGKYLNEINKEIKLIGGHGQGAIINTFFRLLDHRAMLERDIEAIRVGENNESTINLSYSIPEGVKEGKLSTNKQVITLASNYLGKDTFRKPFDIARDFTLNYNWPLVLPNSFSLDSIYNKNLIQQDQKIKELENKILTLENQLNELKKKKS